jgi:uncharacterized protein YifE (UPF0438 family)
MSEDFETFEKKLKNEINQHMELANKISNTSFNDFRQLNPKVNNYADYKYGVTKNMEQQFLREKERFLNEQYENIKKIETRLEEERKFTQILEEQKKMVNKETERKWEKYINRVNKPYRGPLLGMAIREHGQPFKNCSIS